MKPFVVEKRDDHFVVVRAADGLLSSYPTSSSSFAARDAAVLNKTWREAVAEMETGL